MLFGMSDGDPDLGVRGGCVREPLGVVWLAYCWLPDGYAGRKRQGW